MVAGVTVSRFYRLHGLYPLLFLCVATVLLDVLGGDLVIADAIYNVEGGRWQFKDSKLLEGMLHRNGRVLVAVLLLLNLFLWATTWFVTSLTEYRQGLAYLLLTVVTSIVLISVLKAITHIDCPWSYERYGGTGPLLALYRDVFGTGAGRCFPAGHSSGGYAWVASYFFCLLCCPRYRFWALSAGLGLGAVFGIAQQFRGAHLLSHDVWTLAICWCVALGGYGLASRRWQKHSV